MKFTYYGHACFSVERWRQDLQFDTFITPNPLAKEIDVEAIAADFILSRTGWRSRRGCGGKLANAPVRRSSRPTTSGHGFEQKGREERPSDEPMAARRMMLRAREADERDSTAARCPMGAARAAILAGSYSNPRAAILLSPATRR
jgi:hypothetical protein